MNLYILFVLTMCVHTFFEFCALYFLNVYIFNYIYICTWLYIYMFLYINIYSYFLCILFSTYRSISVNFCKPSWSVYFIFRFSVGLYVHVLFDILLSVLGYFVKIFVCCACWLFGLLIEVMHCIILLCILCCWWFVLHRKCLWYLKSLYIYPGCCFGLIRTGNSIISPHSVCIFLTSIISLIVSHPFTFQLKI